MHLLKVLKESWKEKRSKHTYRKPPLSDSIFRPHRTMEQKDGRWNLWHDVFKRGFIYATVRGIFWPVLSLIKRFFRKHDTWPTDGNIPKTQYNKQFYALRKSYENAFEIWLKSYYWQGYKHKCPDFEKFRARVHKSWAQKAIRWYIDFMCLAALEDTVYRELLAVWSFEHQKLMNKIYNPEIQQQHVFYCAYYDGDPRYFELMKQLSNRQKQYRMNADWHDWVEDTQKRFYKDYAEKEKAYLEKIKNEPEKKLDLTAHDYKLKDENAWQKLGQKLPNLTGNKIKDFSAIIKEIPDGEKEDIIVLSVPNAQGESLEQLNNLIKEKYKGHGNIVIINKEFDVLVFKDIVSMIKRGEI